MKRKHIANVIIVICLILAVSSVTAIAQLRVNVMPDGIYNPPFENTAYVWPGKVISIWGNVHGGTPGYTYEWDFDYDAPTFTADTDDAQQTALSHIYTTPGAFTAACRISSRARAEPVIAVSGVIVVGIGAWDATAAPDWGPAIYPDDPSHDFVIARGAFIGSIAARRTAGISRSTNRLGGISGLTDRKP